MNEFVRRIYNTLDINKVAMVKEGLYIVKFGTIQDVVTMVQKGAYYFDNKPFIVNAWNPEMAINTTQIETLPIWAQLLD